MTGNLHRLAQARYDQGAVAPGMRLDHVIVMFRASAVQQAELEQLLIDQQNPHSPRFRQWLTPEDFADQFGLSTTDQGKVAGWLRSEGLTLNATGRASNWIDFSGTAAQISKAFGTPIHRFVVNGETHFANAAEPEVPEALADVIGGFRGLNDFHLRPFYLIVPDLNAGSGHYLAPEDFGTIYDVAPLYQAGINGSGQSIAVVGASNVLLSDIQAFRKRYNLPANDPKFIPYAGTEPGFNSAQVEGNLDLEWAGAVAPNATIYYVYGPDVFTAMVYAVNTNMAPVISVSYGDCEIDYSPSYYRSIAQQANAQGITIVNASGDSGAAGCDAQGSEPFATRGRMADFPAVLPEVTGVGGTQFVETTGTYWAPTNSPNLGSALSYIPEAAWNEASSAGLATGGGGASQLYSRPLWQTGPGVPGDTARHVPDVALSAAIHDAYFITYQGTNTAVAGTSASAPSMAGIIALLNQYQVGNGFLQKPGLGNINPQLYRLAQAVPAAFHDVAGGNNVVPCAQGSPDCDSGNFGYTSGAGYDMATGLGSVDANVLVTQWNTQESDVGVTLTSNTRVTLNDTISATATVTPASGGGTPTGTVSFASNGVALGTVPLSANAGQTSSTLTFPAYLLGTGAVLLSATYSGDAAFSGGGASAPIQITTPARVSAIIPSGPNTVWPAPPDAAGLSWQTTLTLREVGGAAANLTGFTIDGVDQPLAQYFPSPEIAARGTLTTNVVFRNLATPVVRTFGFRGQDASGQTWSRQLSVNYLPLPPTPDFALTATPLVINQNLAANASCQWNVDLRLDELGGFLTIVSHIIAGGVDLSTQIPAIFGTTRLDAWGSLEGIVCLSGITPPQSEYIEVDLSSGVAQEVLVSFAGPPANPVTLSAPSSIILRTNAANQPSQSTLPVGISDKTQSWTAAVFPANRTTAWLSLSQFTGTGPAQVTVTANGTGFEPGVYRATVVIQSQNAAPQSVKVPIVFVLGTNNEGTQVTAVSNPASYQSLASPGMLLSVFGTELANTTATATGNPLAYSLAGVSATVNGIAAPLLYVSSGQVNLQVPYAAGAGPAVLGINNNGQVAGYAFSLSPAAPGVFSDADHGLLPLSSGPAGSVATLYVNGVGEVSPALKTAYSPPASTAPPNLPKPVLPLEVTVGGTPAFLQFAGVAPGLVGVVRVDFTVPASVPTGPQPVVVTVGGVASSPVNFTVTP